METWINKKIAFVGKIFSVITGTARACNGDDVQRDIVDHKGGVAIVPIHNDRVILVNQFRISIASEVLEIPAGRLEQSDESPIERAALELEEEIGFKARDLKLLTVYYSSVGFTNEKMHIFLASQLTKFKRRGDSDEDIRLRYVKITDIETMLKSGEIKDAKTIIGLIWYLNSLRNSN